MAKFKPTPAPVDEPMADAPPFDAEGVAEPEVTPSIAFDPEPAAPVAAEPEEAVVSEPAVEVAPEAPAPEPAFKPAGPSDMVSVNKLGLTRVLIALIQGKDSFNGAGARRAFREIFQCNDEDLEVKWKEVKTYFVGGENYDAIR